MNKRKQTAQKKNSEVGKGTVLDMTDYANMVASKG